MLWFQAATTQGFKWSTAAPLAHSGMDLGMPVGTPLTSPVAGVVIGAAYHTWGGQVDVRTSLGGQPRVLSYLHLSEVEPGLRLGQTLTAGARVGLSGGVNSGAHPTQPQFSTGPHLHFELTAGGVAPYTPAYNPRRPSATSYPLDPTDLLTQIRTTGGLMSGVPTGWTDDGRVLRAPNTSYPIATGMRDYVLSHTWQPNNVPLEAEHAVSRISPVGSTTDLQGAGVIQTFAYTRLYWVRANANMGVTPLGAEAQQLERENAGYATQLTDLHAQNDALQTQIKTLQTALDQLKQTASASDNLDTSALAALARALKPLLTT
ncbi:MAG: peptidoglycan DD-metalloendopeptidase family protein [Chloroflexi bacterium]|nr:peptidoglycan DD-metalloendopeptidase family protein [Chloroflexota bacterium]